MSINSHVQKHRDQFWAVRRRPPEVHLPNDLIDAANSFIRKQNRYLRNIVAYAPQNYLTRNGVLPR